MPDDPSFSLLDAIVWQTAADAAPVEAIAGWLHETGSMTRRLERYCQQVTVVRGREGLFSAAEVGADSDLLPAGQPFWLREVILYGDRQPWLVGRTLVPEATLSGPSGALVSLGDQPLGRWLFAGAQPQRDFIQTGQVAGLWARRSRLLPNGTPLLLTELFLPDAPLYHPDR